MVSRGEEGVEEEEEEEFFKWSWRRRGNLRA
jgi:hypothetical protein